MVFFCVCVLSFVDGSNVETMGGKGIYRGGREGQVAERGKKHVIYKAFGCRPEKRSAALNTWRIKT